MIYEMEDIYSDRSEFNNCKTGDEQFIYYISCRCKQSCKVKLKIHHYHKGRCSIFKNDENHPADSIGDPSFNNVHPKALKFLKQSGQSLQRSQIREILLRMADEANVGREDGRFSIPAKSISNRIHYLSNGSDNKFKNVSMKMQSFFNAQSDVVISDRTDFNPKDFAVLLSNPKTIELSNGFKNRGFLCVDGFWKSTAYNVCITNFVTVDDYGASVILGTGLSSYQTAAQIKRVFDLFEKQLQKFAPLFMPIKLATVDACDATTLVLDEKGIPYIICRFHLLKAVSNHYPKDETLRNQLSRLVYQSMIATNEDEFEETLIQMSRLSENFGSYYRKQWGPYSKQISNMGRTTSMSFQSTNNFCEASIKVLQQAISKKTEKKRSVYQCMKSIIEFLRNQSPNSTRNRISVTEKKQEEKFQAAKSQMVANNSMTIKKSNNLTLCNSFTSENIYEVFLSSNGFNCNCNDFLHQFGQPCKHIYYCLLEENKKQEFCDSDNMNAFAFIRHACIHYGINVELNSNSSIPHFLPNNNLFLTSDHENFPEKKKRKERTESTVTDPELDEEHELDDDSQSGDIFEVNIIGESLMVRYYLDNKKSDLVTYSGGRVFEAKLAKFTEKVGNLADQMKQNQKKKRKNTCNDELEVIGVRFDRSLSIKLKNSNRWTLFSVKYMEELKSFLSTDWKNFIPNNPIQINGTLVKSRLARRSAPCSSSDC